MKNFERDFAEKINTLAESKGNELAEKQKLEQSSKLLSNQIQDKLKLTTIFGGSKQLRELAADSGKDYRTELISLTKQLNKVVDDFDFFSTAKPAIKIHILNYILNRGHLSPDDLYSEVKKMVRWSNLEKEYAQEDNQLPTIGIEVEIPQKHVPKISREILESLSINNESGGFGLWEINPEPSYSSWIQARILQELVQMNIIPVEEIRKDQTKKVAKQEVLSLHVNLGVPSSIQNTPNNFSNLYGTDASVFSDALAYAYSSAYRIRKRKTRDAWNVKSYNVSETSKNKNGDAGLSPLRLEIRPGEFRDYPTYRMLIEAQRLGAALICYIKETENIPLKDKEIELAHVWVTFKKEAQDYLKEYFLKEGSVDRKVKTAALLVKTTKIKNKFRKLVTQKSQEIAKILKI